MTNMRIIVNIILFIALVTILTVIVLPFFNSNNGFATMFGAIVFSAIIVVVADLLDFGRFFHDLTK